MRSQLRANLAAKARAQRNSCIATGRPVPPYNLAAAAAAGIVADETASLPPYDEFDPRTGRSASVPAIPVHPPLVDESASPGMLGMNTVPLDPMGSTTTLLPTYEEARAGAGAPPPHPLSRSYTTSHGEVPPALVDEATRIAAAEMGVASELPGNSAEHDAVVRMCNRRGLKSKIGNLALQAFTGYSVGTEKDRGLGLATDKPRFW